MFNTVSFIIIIIAVLVLIVLGLIRIDYNKGTVIRHRHCC